MTQERGKVQKTWGGGVNQTQENKRHRKKNPGEISRRNRGTNPLGGSTASKRGKR